MNILKALELGLAQTLEQVSSFLLAVHLKYKTKPFQNDHAIIITKTGLDANEYKINDKVVDFMEVRGQV